MISGGKLSMAQRNGTRMVAWRLLQYSYERIYIYGDDQIQLMIELLKYRFRLVRAGSNLRTPVRGIEG